MKAHSILVSATLLIATAAFAAGPKAYVGNFKDSTVSVIDASKDLAAGAIEVGKGPQGLAITPDGRWLLAAVNGEDRVAFIDIATRAVVATVPVPKPHTIAIRPDGRQAYVSSQEPGHFALAVIALASRTVSASLPLEKTPRDLEFGPDGKSLYLTLAGVAAVQVVDPEAHRIVAQIPTGVSPHIAQHFAGTSLGLAVVQGPGELLKFDPASNAPAGSFPVGSQPHWVDVVPGGKKVLVTNEGADSVSAVTLADGATVTIAVGQAPRKVAVQHKAAGAAKVSISNFAFEPAQLAIGAGQGVHWSNDDGAPHGLAFKDGAAGMELMLPGQGFDRVFAKAGVYDYVCAVHPYMTARITVRAP